MTPNTLELSEVLAHGAKLFASADGWSLLYYFPGPDRRWNGTHLKIDSRMLPQYLEAWRRNWQTYLNLRGAVKDVSFSAQGALGMRIGERGVHLHTLSVTSEAELAAMVANLEYAAMRGEELRTQLLAQAGRSELTTEEKQERFSRFKAGEQLGVSQNAEVIRELGQALALVRSKFPLQISSCRHHVRTWFGKQAASEFMEDIRHHGLDVFGEQADFVITWNGRQ